MKWKIMLAAFLLLSIVFVAVTINQSQSETGSSTSEIQVEATRYPFKLTMNLNKTEFKLGEPVNITLRLEFIGNETITLSFTDGCDSFNYRVYDETDHLIYDTYTELVYAQFRLPEEFLKVKPGWTNVWSWFPWYQKNSNHNKVPPGTYKVVGLFISHTLNLIIETPPITISIMK